MSKPVSRDHRSSTDLKHPFGIAPRACHASLFESAPTYARAFLAIWGAAMPSNADPTIARYDSESREILASVIEGGQRDGSISPKINAKATALVLLGLLRGVTGQLMISSDPLGEGALQAECRRVFELALALDRKHPAR